MKRFTGDEKAWPDWRYKFRVEASRRFRQAAAILDWAEDVYDQPISKSDIQRVAAKENWVDVANFNMQIHGDLVSLVEKRTKGFEIVRTGRDWVTSTIFVTRCETYSCSHRRKLAMLTWSQAWGNSRKNCELFVRGLATTCRIFGKSTHVVCILKICPKIFKDHLAVQTSTIDSLRNRDQRSRSFCKRMYMGQELHTWICKTKGGKKGGKGKDKEPGTKKLPRVVPR